MAKVYLQELGPIETLLKTHGADDLLLDKRSRGFASWTGGIEARGGKRISLDLQMASLQAEVVIVFYALGDSSGVFADGAKMGKRRWLFLDPKRVEPQLGRLFNAIRETQKEREKRKPSGGLLGEEGAE